MRQNQRSENDELNPNADESRKTTRRQLLKTGAVGLVAATLGTSSFVCDAEETQANGFPFGLDANCPSYGEHRRRRKQAGKPLDGVVVSASNPSIVRDSNRCANCGRCDEACMSQSISHWYDRATLKDGVETICVNCGQCVTACKFNVLHERLQYPEVWSAISNDETATKRTKTFVATTAPAIRVSLGEMFGLAPGANLEKKNRFGDSATRVRFCL